MDDDSDCELVDVKGFFCFPKTRMGTASNNHALENEGIYIIYRQLFPFILSRAQTGRCKPFPKSTNAGQWLPLLKCHHCVVGV